MDLQQQEKNQLFALSLPLCVAAANAGMFLVVLVVHQRYQQTQWRQTRRYLTVLFPSEAPQR